METDDEEEEDTESQSETEEGRAFVDEVEE